MDKKTKYSDKSEYSDNLQDTSIFYDIRPIRSYNRVLNFVLGGRGIGKTFSFKKWAVEDFLSNGKKFIYMRRHETEFKDREMNENFFPAALRAYFPEHTFKFYQGAYYIDDKMAGFPMILSKAGYRKSVEFDDVNKVLFDEFLIDQGSMYHYLSDEVIVFAEAMETIARFKKVQFFLFSNSVSVNNPYFVKFGIELPEEGKEFRKTKHYVVQCPEQSEYVKAKRKTAMGSLMADLMPEYFAYAYENEMLRDRSDFIRDRSKQSAYLYTLIYNGQTMGVWFDQNESNLYITRKIDENYRAVYTINAKDHTEASQLILRKNPAIKYLIDFFREARCYFSDQQVKGIMIDFFKKFM